MNTKKKQGNKLNSKIFKINQEQEKELQEINNEIQQLENENNKKINEFNSLNFLKLIQKDKLKTEINNNKQRIESLKIKADNIKEENNVKIQILEQKFKEDIAEEECKADLECIYPLNPEELIFSLYSPMGKNRIENAQILQEIYSTMYYDNEEFTIDMLASELDIPSQKIYLMLNYLKRQNLVERTSYTTTTSYFQIKYSDDELDKGINTKFSKDRRFLYAYMNRVKKKSISEIFKEIETISFIRIAQALESLVEQYILGKKVEDDEVYYFILIDM